MQRPIESTAESHTFFAHHFKDWTESHVDNG